MRRPATLFLIALLVGCAPARDREPEVEVLCATIRDDSSEPLRAQVPRDAAVLARFGEVCRPLVRMDGTDLGATRSVYRCRYFVPHDREERAGGALAALADSFGRPILWKEGLNSWWSREDVRSRVLTLRQAMGRRMTERDMPLSFESSWFGFAAVAVILAGDSPDPPTVLLTRGELDDAQKRTAGSVRDRDQGPAINVARPTCGD